MSYFLMLGLWPILNFLSNNLTRLNSYWYFSSLSILFILSILGMNLLIQKFAKRDKEYYLGLFLFLTIMFFSYSPLCDSLGTLYNPEFFKITYLYVILTIVGSLGVSYICKYPITKILSKTIISVLFIFSLGSTLLSCFNSWSIQEDREISKKTDDIAFKFKSKPNIYYILADGYGRQDTLKEVCNHDNSDFLDSLDEMGFYIGKHALSNYHFTGASLSATMDMYYHKLDPKTKQVEANGQMKQSLLGNNNVRKILKENSYKIIDVPAHWDQIGCNGYEDKCVKTFSADIIETFFTNTPLKFLFKYNYFKYVDLVKIREFVHAFPDHPKFVFIHLAQVHDAIYNQDGTYNFSYQCHPILSNVEDSKEYVWSVQNLNKEIYNFISYIRDNDPKAIIILQADHGPSYVGGREITSKSYWLENITTKFRISTPEQFKYMYGILSAVLIPENSNNQIKKYFTRAPTTVNTFRVIFSYLSEKPLNLLEDSFYFLYMGNQKDLFYKVIEVSKLRKD